MTTSAQSEPARPFMSGLLDACSTISPLASYKHRCAESTRSSPASSERKSATMRPCDHAIVAVNDHERPRAHSSLLFVESVFERFDPLLERYNRISL